MPQKKVAQYRHLKFSTQAQFHAWLKDHAAYIIRFEDRHQDFLEWHIDAGGEVLHSDMQSFVWCGEIVDVQTLLNHRRVVLLDGREIKYAVESVIPLPGKISPRTHE